MYYFQKLIFKILPSFQLNFVSYLFFFSFIFSFIFSFNFLLFLFPLILQSSIYPQTL